MKFTLADAHARQLSRKQVAQLFARPNLLRLAFLDEKGRPMVHPVWYYYSRGKFYFATDRNGRKAGALRKNPDVYFLVDENPSGEPPLGVRGRGTAKVIDDSKYATRVTRRCVKRYLGTTKSKSAKMVIAMGPDSCVVEVTPSAMASWKF
ncbi:putative flavin-nucleotide-binding protein [Candidatus Nitrososphaera evergladensis SR1]|uniref:Putative flavin-nucleotide-binding protein n=1 Tax=Candidatus Nitrososphaera evergladensis SR1 TaxID=1459636 RepID=A0A075MUS1_9ARCH|nr:pyridoxamine 5'-phosphate oxidase family protein [Candidatus Nitrososphaera evergladensis]AIF84422.1 putative flavin-nucleotide-binding protein [Candidatus Nitrososphaera evergladensis SR1]